ncbi:MAG: TVP38/TMEM64 family protein [Clostridiales bacterium]|nr:TVP38/TMEM64 family protein [Clostridiales bacterium]
MKKTFKIILVILAAAAIIALCVWMIPAVLSLRAPENQQRFREFIDSLGYWGIALMLFIQVLQIVVAVIPGEPIELLMGLMYGAYGGCALTLVGILLGSTIVYFAVKRFGVGFAKKFIDIDNFEKLKFLHDPNKRDSLIFLLFFIPGTPKDILTYFAPFTDIPFLRFAIISTLARIPSVITSTIVGAAVSEGNFGRSILVFVITGVIGIAGILLNNYITNKHNKQNLEKK